MNRRWMVDFDTTLARVFENQIARHNDRFGTSYSVGDFTSWDTSKVLGPEENEAFWQDFLDPGTTEWAVPVILGPRSVRDIRKCGDEVYIVSDRPLELRVPTYNWLKEWDLDSFPLVLTRSPKSRGDRHSGIPTKRQVVWGLGLTHVVEDAPHHASGLSRAPTVEQVYLIDTPANQSVKNQRRGTRQAAITRVQSWEDIMEGEQIW
jgi:hypothetical protein